MALCHEIFGFLSTTSSVVSTVYRKNHSSVCAVRVPVSKWVKSLWRLEV